MDLKGKKIVLTGSFGDLSRDEAISKLEAAGAEVTDSMGFDVDFVFAGEGAGAAIDDAMELGVRIREGSSLDDLMSGKGSVGPAPDLQMPHDAEMELPPAELAAPPRDEPLRSAPHTADAKAPSQGASKAKPTPNPSSGERVMEKGARVRIVGGYEGVGEVGDIFWWGESKFGEGMRAGVTAEDGTKYWVDEENLAWPDADIDPEVLEEAKKAAEFGKGDRVRIKNGKDAGVEGTIFWWGESKWGDGMRAGIETDDGETVWSDAADLEAVEGPEDDIPF